MGTQQKFLGVFDTVVYRVSTHEDTMHMQPLYGESLVKVSMRTLKVRHFYEHACSDDGFVEIW